MLDYTNFNEVDILQKGKEYVCVIDDNIHIFPTMEDANNYIYYQAKTEYSYQIHNIKCTEVIL